MKALIHLTVILAISSFIYVAYTQKQSQASVERVKYQDNRPTKVLIEIEAADKFSLAFKAILTQESGLNHYDKYGRPKISKSGAVGIAQVLPSTAPEACGLAGYAYSEKRLYNDVEYNKACGEAYFKKQLVDFDGNLPHAFAAYNAGPTITRYMVKNHGKNWLKKLPKETQHYVAISMYRYNKWRDASKFQLKYITKPVTVASN